MPEFIYHFLLGTCFMFSLMIAWLFWRNRHDTISRLVVTLMIVVSVGFIKDLFSSGGSMLSVAADIVAVPLYASILYELCVPGQLKIKTIFFSELPFVILPILIAITRSKVFFYLDLVFGIIVGLVMFTWTCFAIPRYNRRLKATFSYDDDIDLRWLRFVLWSFFVLLAIWGLSCVLYNPLHDIAYMCCSLIMWGFISFFLYKHKTVVDELKPSEAKCTLSDSHDGLFERIRTLIASEKLYLNPQLKLSDIARIANTNRSYASAFFNSQNTTFYDYINGLRIEYAKTLLADSSRRVEDIAFDSGYNSRQSFNRIFRAIEGISPTEFRIKMQSSVN